MIINRVRRVRRERGVSVISRADMPEVTLQPQVAIVR